jgi:CheY-specific phosphatase CheX
MVDKNKIVNQFAISLKESLASLLKNYVDKEFTEESSHNQNTELKKSFYTACMSFNCTADEKVDLNIGIFLHWELKTYLDVSSGMLGEKYTTYSDEIDDVGLEILNMTVGLKKQYFSDIGLKLGDTLPIKISGNEYATSTYKCALSKDITLVNNNGNKVKIVVYCFPTESLY